MFKEKYEKVITLLKENSSIFCKFYKDLLKAYSKIPQNMQESLITNSDYEFSPHPHHYNLYAKYTEMYDDNSIHGMEIKVVDSCFSYKLYIDNVTRYTTIEPFKKPIAKIKKKSNRSSESVQYVFVLNFNGKTTQIEVVRTAEEDKLLNTQLLDVFSVNLNELLDGEQNCLFNP